MRQEQTDFIGDQLDTLRDAIEITFPGKTIAIAIYIENEDDSAHDAITHTAITSEQIERMLQQWRYTMYRRFKEDNP